ncbi:MAG: hypothetical protein U9Q03_01645 [Patescibacteria group bacterium]|nr:hypothetical protein [Patescibacteria group bacterium]
MDISKLKNYKVIVIIVAVLLALVLLLVRNGAETPGETSESEILRPTLLAPSPQGGIIDLVDKPSGIPFPDEVREPEPLPPVQIFPKSSQGLNRIAFNPPIGDVFQIHYDRSSGNLFMAAVEDGGFRAIWRLSPELELRRVLTGTSDPGETFLQADSKGVLYAGFAHPGYLFRSDDLGDTWEWVADDIGETFWSIADDGEGTLWGALHAYNEAILYRSTDDGHSWEKWVDFHEVYPQYAVRYDENDRRFKLRHLHDVAYQDGKLFVGVGDFTRMTLMSEDGGVTWREVWNEGFTAHVPLVDGSGLLLGPDRLQARGLALYRFGEDGATEVWNPAPYDYAGYTYSMLELGGMYFAGFHIETTPVEGFHGKTGIIVSPDGRKWYPFLELDPVSNWARTDIFMAPHDQWSGYVTLNGALYMFEAPIGRWFEVHSAFGE